MCFGALLPTPVTRGPPKFPLTTALTSYANHTQLMFACSSTECFIHDMFYFFAICCCVATFFSFLFLFMILCCCMYVKAKRKRHEDLTRQKHEEQQRKIQVKLFEKQKWNRIVNDKINNKKKLFYIFLCFVSLEWKARGSTSTLFIFLWNKNCSISLKDLHDLFSCLDY